ncbi:kinase-like protein [Calocera viscosa TUFC12733]|uniref:non-specific serine/threonine protein kinase n=1 Tax=Calocera viscosa (strain TUFC12733) TaxID=1330018 RepID=A0A167G2Y4_CALVF|nr:kinase-like protein [Calocera viscosa TUFC12733]
MPAVLAYRNVIHHFLPGQPPAKASSNDNSVDGKSGSSQSPAPGLSHNDNITPSTPRTPPSRTPSLKEDSPGRSSLDEEAINVIPVVSLKTLVPMVNRDAAQAQVLKDHLREHGVYDYAELQPSTRLILKKSLEVVVGKVGTGTTACVYLFKNLTPSSDLPRFTAVKVSCAAFSETLAREELAFLDRVRLANHSHPGYNHVASVLSCFSIESPFGRHLCMVLPLLAQPLDKRMASLLTLSAKKKVIGEIILGLAYLHDECGIIHTDLTLGNVLVKISEKIAAPDMILTKDEWIEIATLQHPAKLVMRVNAKLHDSVVQIPITGDQPLQVPSLQDISVSIVDLSAARWRKAPHNGLVQNDLTRAPEVTLGRNWDSSVDIWSLGHLVFQLVSGMDLIPVPTAAGQSFDDNYRLASLGALLGDYTQDFLQDCPLANEFFDRHGGLLRHLHVATETLEERTVAIFPGRPAEQSSFANLLRQLLQIQPNCRPQARNLWGHAWLQEATGDDLSLERPTDVLEL